MERRVTDCDHDLVWDEQSREVLLQDSFITITSSSYALPDGSEAGPYYVYSTKDSVCVIAVTDDGDIVCVRQFRPGVARVITELPAGAIDVADADAADPRDPRAAVIAAAARELREETGYVARDLRYLGSAVLHATICRDVNHCVLASGCAPAGAQDLDPTEFMRVQLMTPDELDDLVRQGRFLQLSHAHAWLRWGGLARECGGGAR